jgi:hypothetical protein
MTFVRDLSNCRQQAWTWWRNAILVARWRGW